MKNATSSQRPCGSLQISCFIVEKRFSVYHYSLLLTLALRLTWTFNYQNCCWLILCQLTNPLIDCHSSANIHMPGIHEMCPVMLRLWSINVEVTEPNIFCFCLVAAAFSVPCYPRSDSWVSGNCSASFQCLCFNIPGKPKWILRFRMNVSHAVTEQVLPLGLCKSSGLSQHHVFPSF